MGLISDALSNVVVSVKALDSKIDAAVARIEAAATESASDLDAVKALGDQVNAIVGKVDGIDPAPVVVPTPEVVVEPSTDQAVN